MKDEFANRQSMHLTILDLLDNPAYKSIWEDQNPTAFTTKAVLFRQQVSGLTDLIAKQEANLLGRAEQKEREQSELEAIAHEIGQLLAGYYEESGMEAKAAEFDLSISGWRRLRDTALLAKATLLKDSLTEALATNAPALAEYGLSPADLIDLEKELTDYAAVIKAPSGGIATRKALTAALRPDFREVSVTLKSMDRLILRFRRTPEGAAFAENWKAARTIRNLGSNNLEPPTP